MISSCFSTIGLTAVAADDKLKGGVRHRKDRRRIHEIKSTGEFVYRPFDFQKRSQFVRTHNGTLSAVMSVCSPDPAPLRIHG